MHRFFRSFDDGSSWRPAKVEAPGRVEHWGHVHPAPHDTTSAGGEGPGAPAPELRYLRRLIGEDRIPGSAQVVIEGLDLLPPDLLEKVPPGVIDEVMKEMRALGLGDLFGPAKRDCDGCPKKDTCKGDCDGCPKKGTCEGDCKDCPQAKDGSCTGDCEGCPSRKDAGKKEGCGSCPGGAAK